MKTTQTVEALLRPVVTGMGYELDEVEFQKEQGNWVLTLYIEHQDGRSATIDDCEAVSRAVDPILDEADPIEQAYYLSVSSIGIDRPLKKDRDYQRSLGSPITVKLYAPLKGKKEYTGELLSYTPDSFTISVKGEEMTFQKKDASKVQPYIDFKALEKDLDELEADFENIETEEEIDNERRIHRGTECHRERARDKQGYTDRRI